MSELKSYEFTCKLCKGVFEREWTEEKALAEYRKMFGGLPDALKKDKDVLCDDCYKKLMIKVSQ
jgi:hypothetical protein